MPGHVAGAKQRLFDAKAGRRAHRRVAAICSAASHRPEELVERRIVDHADAPLAIDHEGDRHTPVANAVHEVDCSVDRIDDPGIRAELAAVLFAEHAVGWKCTRELFSNQRFHLVIGGADPILRALCLCRVRELAQKIAASERTRFAREQSGEARPRVDLGRGHAAAIGTTPWLARTSDTLAPAASGRSTAMLTMKSCPIAVSTVYSISPPM